MITIWEQTGTRGFQQVEQYGKKSSWINVENPTNNEIESLRAEFSIPADLINDTIDVDERARIENDEGWTLVVIRIPVPVNTEKRGVQMYTVPLSILLSKDIIITVCLHENQVTSSPALFKMEEFNFDRPIDFVLCMMMQAANKYLDYLKIINRQSDQISKAIRVSTKNSELILLLRLEKVLVYFITSLRSNDTLLAKFKRTKYINPTQIDQDLLEDVIVEMRQATETANIHSDVLSGMMDAQASLISNNLNKVMKLLTTISIVLMIPTLIASYFGMNVPNGWEEYEHGFLLVVVISVAITAISVWFFKLRRWF